MKTIFDNYTQKNSLTKTACFELKSQGETKHFINENGILLKDKEKAEAFKKSKKIADEYHKNFIEKTLNTLTLEGLQKFYTLYNKKSKDIKDKKDLETIRIKLRRQISESFSKSDNAEIKDIFDNLFKKEFITGHLLDSLTNEEEKESIRFFGKNTTYFDKYHMSRKNIYSSKDISSSIGHRIINENLPKFLENLSKYKEAKKDKIDFSNVETGLNNITNGARLDEIFSLEYFNKILTQKGIEIYNSVVGGVSEDGRKKIQGVNELINLHNQTKQSENLKSKKDKNNDKESKEKDFKPVPKLSKLFKQILSDRNSTSFIFEEFDEPQDLLDAIGHFAENELYNFNSDGKNINVLGAVEELLININNSDLSKIYINKKYISDVSQKIFKDPSLIKDALTETFIKNLGEKNSSFEKRRSTWLKKNQFDIHTIDISINTCTVEKVKELGKTNIIATYFSSEVKVIVEKINKFYEEIQPLLNIPHEEGKSSFSYPDKIKIQSFLESIMDLLHFVKPLNIGNDDEVLKDEVFYADYFPLFQQLNESVTLFIKARNFITKKPYSIAKIKANFGSNKNFGGGWIDSKTGDSDNGTQFGSYLFRRKNSIGEHDYFVGFSSNAKLFRCHLKDEVKDPSEFERLERYTVNDKAFYGSSYAGVKEYKEDKDGLMATIVMFLKNIKDEDAKKTLTDTINKNKGTEIETTPLWCINTLEQKFPRVLIELCKDKNFILLNKEMIHNLVETIKKQTRVPQRYKLLGKTYVLFSDVMKDVEQMCKEVVTSYFPVSTAEWVEATTTLDSGRMLWFKITNKDLSFADKYIEGNRACRLDDGNVLKDENGRIVRGNDNLHTTYLKQFMEGNQNVIDIGTAEIFHRRSSIAYSEEIIELGHHYKKLKEKFSYPIIKDKRFTEDKFSFHISFTLNYQKPKETTGMNLSVLHYLKNTESFNILGIDRGERNLIYFTVIDQKGNIITKYDLNGNVILEGQGSLNNISSNSIHSISVDYREKILDKERNRAKARRDWTEIGSIKELKNGFISQVLPVVIDLMFKHNAILSLESLSKVFTNGRKKRLDIQVYQKFEKALIDKLNYLWLKNKKPQEVGGVLNAYQLTENFVSFEEMKTQSGFLFYVPPARTSNICPTTGFSNFLKVKHNTCKKSQDFFKSFSSIKYNSTKNYFEFKFDYVNFDVSHLNNPEDAKNTKTLWTACTHDGNIRLKYNNTTRDSEEIYLTAEFKKLFNDNFIKFDDGEDLIDSIYKADNAEFYTKLMNLLYVLLSLRYYRSGTDTDFILSPIADINGEFFDSTKGWSNMPKNGDANGAYHIALKLLLVIKKINESEDLQKVNLFVTNVEWLNFAQNREVIMGTLPIVAVVPIEKII